MIPRVMHAEYLGEYKIRLRFADGAEGDVDLSSELYGEIFEPLKDKNLFRRFSIHPEFGTLVCVSSRFPVAGSPAALCAGFSG